MAGGSSSRGSRKAHRNGERSYCVENHASSATNHSTPNSVGLEDGVGLLQNESINAPLLDVRYSSGDNSYCLENDPASARGDLPKLSGLHNVPAAAAAASSSSAIDSPQQQHRYANNGDDDVRDTMATASTQQQSLEAEHLQFIVALKKQGLEIVEQAGDGNCLFRAISLQVYGDASAHLEVRHRCLDFMVRSLSIVHRFW